MHQFAWIVDLPAIESCSLLTHVEQLCTCLSACHTVPHLSMKLNGRIASPKQRESS